MLPVISEKYIWYLYNWLSGKQKKILTHSMYLFSNLNYFILTLK